MAVHFKRIVAGFSRYRKYTLGAELRNKSRGVVGRARQVNPMRDKLPRLLAFRESLEGLTILGRLAKEVRALQELPVIPVCG